MRVTQRVSARRAATIASSLGLAQRAPSRVVVLKWERKEASEGTNNKRGRGSFHSKSSGTRIKGAGGMGMQRIWFLAWPDRLPAMGGSVLGGGAL